MRNEITNKSIIEDLESQIDQLKSDAYNMVLDKQQLEYDVSLKRRSSQIFLSEVCELNEKIRVLNEQKEKMELVHIETLYNLKNSLKEKDNQNTQLIERIEKCEGKIQDLILTKEKDDKNIENLLSKLNQIENEYSIMKSKYQSKEKEYVTLIKENDEHKKFAEKHKQDFIEFNDKIKSIKEKKVIEIKDYETRILNLEKKIEKERNKNMNLTEKLKEAFSNKGTSTTGEGAKENPESADNELILKKNSHNVKERSNSSLSDVLDMAQKDNSLTEKILLQTEIQVLNTKILELSNRNFNKNKAEIEILSKENSSLKQEIKEIIVMYENQIKDLQKMNVNVNAEFQSLRRASILNYAKLGDQESLSKFLQTIHDLENKLKLSKAEAKYLDEKVTLLTRDIETQKQLREKDAKFFKEELNINDKNFKSTTSKFKRDKKKQQKMIPWLTATAKT